MTLTETPRVSRAAPLALLGVVLLMTGVVAYHALDSWYLQTANASRLKADYSEIAAIRFNTSADSALSSEIGEALRSIRTGTAVHSGALSPAYTFRISLAGPVSEFTGSTPHSARQDEIVRAVRADALSTAELPGSFRVLSVSGSGIVYAVTRDLSGGTELIGFPFADADYARILGKTFAGKRLLPSGVPAGQSNANAFTIHVSTGDGRTLFRSGYPRPDDYVARSAMDERFGEVSTAVSARKSAVAWLATEHLASRMALILWLTAFAALATIMSVRLMRREARLLRAHSDFVSSVSHELRTPLAQVQIFLETLRLDRFSTPAERDWLFAGMQREITRLTALVNNVLQFSRSERTGHSPRQRGEQTELRPFLAELVTTFAPLAAVRSMRVEAECTDSRAARISPDALRQVMLNLLDNAVKYGKAGQVIRVSATSANGRCSLFVDDEGPGVSALERGRVWEKFQRGSGASAVAAGSGIGLSVVKDLVSAHDGSVSVTDAPGGGARFIVDLPAVQSGPANP